METSYDLTAVLNELCPGGFLGIGHRLGLCVWRGEQEVIKHFGTKRGGHKSYD